MEIWLLAFSCWPFGFAASDLTAFANGRWSKANSLLMSLWQNSGHRVGKVANISLPALSHHRTYRSGIRRFVRIIVDTQRFAKRNNSLKSQRSLLYANIECSAFAAVLDCGIPGKVSCWCFPTCKPSSVQYLSSPG